MVGIILGGLLGATIGCILMMLLWTTGDNCFGKWEYFWKCVAVIVFIVAIVGGGIAGGLIDYGASCEYVAEYTAVKTTIETSLNCEDLTGFERAELVSKAAEYNGELGAIKVACSKWYGVTLTDEILDLEYIDLSGATGNG